MGGRRRVATYRLQFSPSFTFADAAEIIPSLRDLGISHLYASPIAQAAAGSTHGYDVADPTTISDDLGGEHAFTALADAAHAAGMGILLDIVPNHLGIADMRNRWWRDVLADGAQSPSAAIFDIDWEHPHPLITGRVLLPILPTDAGRSIRRGDVCLTVENGLFDVKCFDQRLPLNIETVGDLAARIGAAEIAAAIGTLSPAADAGAREARMRQRVALLDEMARHIAADPAPAQRLVTSINTRPARLDDILALQHYRLAHWRLGNRELNYRRFFDITTLVALRMEDEPAFELVHALPARLLSEGRIDGIRIDHVDGLRDPAAYLRRLRSLVGPQAWIVVEKILGTGERLPAWPVEGTTGYETSAAITRLLSDPLGEPALTALHERMGGAASADATIAEARAEVATGVLQADVFRLAHLFFNGLSTDNEIPGASLTACEEAVIALLVELPVYRTYCADGGCSASDIAILEAASQRACEHHPEAAALIAHLTGILISNPGSALTSRFQQVSSALAAKGVEDTASYRYIRLTSHCEVGADLAVFSDSNSAFHAEMSARAAMPDALNADTTHDTKRSADARARLLVLAQLPREWAGCVAALRAAAAPHRREARVDRLTEYLFFQTLVAAHPLTAERARDYMLKASREAKRRTSWLRPSQRFESALCAYIDATLSDAAFIATLGEFMRRVEPHARSTAWIQTILKLTLPGVPDIYQGDELWNPLLVDPDNRRPVDFAQRADLARRAAEVSPLPSPDEDAEGISKLAVTRSLLALRAEREDAFTGSYRPMETGEEASVAFERGGEVVVVVRKFVTQPSRGRITLAAGGWRDRISGRRCQGDVAIAGLLTAHPAAVLVRERD